MRAAKSKMGFCIFLIETALPNTTHCVLHQMSIDLRIHMGVLRTSNLGGGAVNFYPKDQRDQESSQKNYQISFWFFRQNCPNETDMCPIEGGCSPFAIPSPTLMGIHNL